jgi:hypothetical protein
MLRSSCDGGVARRLAIPTASNHEVESLSNLIGKQQAITAERGSAFVSAHSAAGHVLIRQGGSL